MKMKVPEHKLRVLGGSPPYGYRRSYENKYEYEPDPDEQAILRKVKILVAHGHSCDTIAKTLNTLGVANRGGGPFRGNQISRMLHVKRRDGRVLYQRVVVPLRLRQKTYRAIKKLAAADKKPLATWIVFVLEAYAAELLAESDVPAAADDDRQLVRELPVPSAAEEISESDEAEATDVVERPAQSRRHPNVKAISEARGDVLHLTSNGDCAECFRNPMRHAETCSHGRQERGGSSSSRLEDAKPSASNGTSGGFDVADLARLLEENGGKA
jgi:hypothetical protein